MESLDQELQKHLEVVRSSVIPGRYTPDAVEESIYRLVEIQEQDPKLSISKSDMELLDMVIIKYGL